MGDKIAFQGRYELERDRRTRHGVRLANASRIGRVDGVDVASPFKLRTAGLLPLWARGRRRPAGMRLRLLGGYGSLAAPGADETRTRSRTVAVCTGRAYCTGREATSLRLEGDMERREKRSPCISGRGARAPVQKVYAKREAFVRPSARSELQLPQLTGTFRRFRAWEGPRMGTGSWECARRVGLARCRVGKNP